MIGTDSYVLKMVIYMYYMYLITFLLFLLYVQSAMEILLETDIVLDIFYQQGFLDVI